MSSTILRSELSWEAPAPLAWLQGAPAPRHREQDSLRSATVPFYQTKNGKRNSRPSKFCGIAGAARDTSGQGWGSRIDKDVLFPVSSTLNAPAAGARKYPQKLKNVVPVTFADMQPGAKRQARELLAGRPEKMYCSPISSVGRRPAGAAPATRYLKMNLDRGRPGEGARQISGAPAAASQCTEISSGAPHSVTH